MFCPWRKWILFVHLAIQDSGEITMFGKGAGETERQITWCENSLLNIKVSLKQWVLAAGKILSCKSLVCNSMIISCNPKNIFNFLFSPNFSLFLMILLSTQNKPSVGSSPQKTDPSHSVISEWGCYTMRMKNRSLWSHGVTLKIPNFPFVFILATYSIGNKLVHCIFWNICGQKIKLYTQGIGSLQLDLAMHFATF